MAGTPERHAARVGTVTLNAAIDKRYVVARVQSGEVNRVRDCTLTAGGKGLNVARVATIAGASVVATGFLGGHAGAFIADELGHDGIRDEFVRVAGESRSCINVLDEATGSTTEYLEPGIEVTDADVERLCTAFAATLDDSDVVVLSGSAPRGCSTDIYATLVRLANDRGAPVLVDTSGAFLRAAVDAGPTLIKPNADEVRALAGGPVDDDDGLVALGQQLNRAGVASVVFSRGAAGALLVSADGVFVAHAPTVVAVNTVGCGDAMTAALAIALADGRGPRDTLRYGVAVGSAAAMTPGTGSFRPHDLELLLAGGITVDRID